MGFLSCYSVPNNCFTMNCALNVHLQGLVSDFAESKVVKILPVDKDLLLSRKNHAIKLTTCAWPIYVKAETYLLRCVVDNFWTFTGRIPTFLLCSLLAFKSLVASSLFTVEEAARICC